jgi:O-antigen/teichoic acid export membrane protein
MDAGRRGVAPTAGTARATTIVAVGMMGMNVLAYAFTLAAAHRLGPTEFGGVSALLGVLIVANVGALALQATAARRLATAPNDQRPGVAADVVRSAIRVALVLGALLLAATPVMNSLLHLDDWVAAAMVAVACIPLTLMGAYSGIVQGERRWTSLALIYLAMGAGRIVCGGIALFVDPSMRSAMIGIAIGSFAPALVGAWFNRVRATPTSGHQPVLGELWRNGHTLLAFFAFTNLDVLLARHLFSSTDAGIYAAGAILSKSCLFLPTFVLVVAFPTMASDRRGRPWLKPLLLVLALGSVVVLGVWLLPDLAVAFAGGSEYADLGDVAWLFALEGTLFAALQILVYDTIAGQTHAAFVLWLGSALVCIVAALAIGSVGVLVAFVSVVAFGIGLVTGLMPGATHPD